MRPAGRAWPPVRSDANATRLSPPAFRSSHGDVEALAPRAQADDAPEGLRPAAAERDRLPPQRSYPVEIEQGRSEAVAVEHEAVDEAELAVPQPRFDRRREPALVAPGEDRRR